MSYLRVLYLASYRYDWKSDVAQTLWNDLVWTKIVVNYIQIQPTSWQSPTVLVLYFTLLWLCLFISWHRPLSGSAASTHTFPESWQSPHLVSSQWKLGQPKLERAWYSDSDDGDAAFEIGRDTEIAVGEEPCVLLYIWFCWLLLLETVVSNPCLRVYLLKFQSIMISAGIEPGTCG